MAGSSDYPTSVDNKTQLQDGIDYIEADNVNNAYVPINKTQTFIGANGKGASWSTDILEYLANNKGPICTKKDADEIYVSAGVVFVKNSGQTNRIMRRNTSVTTISAADLDTGSMAVGYYYIYAVADSAATTFTVKFSASASAPTGLTNFELIGWFYNETSSVLDITSGFVGNVKANGRDVPNQVQVVETTDYSETVNAAYTAMTRMSLRFYTSGRPLLVLFDIVAAGSGADTEAILTLHMDGSSQSLSGAIYSYGPQTAMISAIITPAAGTHQFDVRHKQGSPAMSTMLVKGSTKPGNPMFQIIEL